MQKIRKILEFILALLNFLFHFKPAPDEKPPVNTQTYPDPDLQERDEPLFETVDFLRERLVLVAFLAVAAFNMFSL